MDARLTSAPSKQSKSPAPESPRPGSAGNSFDLPDIEPMTLSLMGRFFGVPLLIIGTIVGGAVLVVFLFGAPASPQVRGLDDLLRSLESSTGQKSMGMLLPQEKEHWQTGLELTVRLQKKVDGLTAEELDEVAARVGRMVHEELEARNASLVPSVEAGRQNAPTRLEFLLRALGETGSSLAIGPLNEALERGGEEYAFIAMQQLGNLSTRTDVREAIDPILAALQSAKQPEAKLVACTTLSVIASPTDRRVLEALEKTRLSDEGEVAWSAALALARLGSPAGKSTLLDLLDRPFWESPERYRTVDAKGQERRYAMPPSRVDVFLVAAIDAISNLDDPDLWEMIERLKSDPSPRVRSTAAEAVNAHKG